MSWERLPDRTTESGQILRTEVGEVDGETWFVGSIPNADVTSFPRSRRRYVAKWWMRPICWLLHRPTAFVR